MRKETINKWLYNLTVSVERMCEKCIPWKNGINLSLKLILYIHSAKSQL